jgi:hypothetical protein
MLCIVNVHTVYFIPSLKLVYGISHLLLIGTGSKAQEVRMPHGHISRVRALVYTHGMPSGAFLGQPISTSLMVKLNMVGLPCHKVNQCCKIPTKIVSLTTKLAAFVVWESNYCAPLKMNLCLQAFE